MYDTGSVRNLSCVAFFLNHDEALRDKCKGHRSSRSPGFSQRVYITFLDFQNTRPLAEEETGRLVTRL